MAPSLIAGADRCSTGCQRTRDVENGFQWLRNLLSSRLFFVIVFPRGDESGPTNMKTASGVIFT